MADKKINIHIGSGFDGSGIQEASSMLSGFQNKLMESNKTLLQINAEMSRKMKSLAQAIAVDFGDAADKAARGMGRTYETLDQINARIDAPKRMAREQAKLNEELQRYCQLCDDARRKEKARLQQWTNSKSMWNNGPGAGILATPGTGGSSSAGGSSGAGSAGAGFARSARMAIPAMMAIDRMSGGRNNMLSTAANGIMGTAAMYSAFGPVGAIVGAAQAGIDAAQSAYVNAELRKLKEAQEVMADIDQRLSSMKNDLFQKFAKDIEGVASATEKAAERFEFLAEKQSALRKVSIGIDAAAGQTELLRMQKEMSVDVYGADEGSRGRVAAEWRMRIAQKEVELRERAANLEESDERETLQAAQDRAELSKRRLGSLAAAEERARAEYERVKSIHSTAEGGEYIDQNAEVKRYKDLYESARERTRGAAKDYDAKNAALEIAREQSRLGDENRSNSLMRARNAAAAAEMEYDKALKDERIAAEAELARERDRIERDLHKKRMDDLREEIAAQKDAASAFRAAANTANTEFERAFAMYRDPSRAAAEIGEEKDRAADLDRLHRDAARYGGKWRIDELSQLMSSGDQQGVQARLEDWRKSRSFTPEVEAMVRASAAEQTRTTAEDELRKLNAQTGDLSQRLAQMSQSSDGKLEAIGKNTAQLAAKLDDLLSVKG